MNNKQRERIREIAAAAEELVHNIAAIRDEAEEKYDGMSDRFQESEKGEQAQETIDKLTGIADAIEEQANELADIANGDEA